MYMQMRLYDLNRVSGLDTLFIGSETSFSFAPKAGIGASHGDRRATTHLLLAGLLTTLATFLGSLALAPTYARELTSG